jgi:hypothetical protein
MISTQPFPTIEKCDCLGFEFITKKDPSYWYKNMRMIAEIIHDHVSSSYAIVHLDTFWLLYKENLTYDDVLRNVTSIVSDLGRVFLSRIHMSTYAPGWDTTVFIEKIIYVNAIHLFDTTTSQADMFGPERTFEMMSEELRKGLWIT